MISLIALAAAVLTPNYAPPPGALNPNVTQANIATTICTSGWSASVRPPQAYTENLKRRQMRERHLPGRLSDYEEDHLVSLTLGGATADISNLWPQRRSGANGAGAKDKLEARLHAEVCAGRMTLATGRKRVAHRRKAFPLP